jgi:hypothetical protein
MTIGPDHKIPWQDQPLFWKKGMLNPTFSNFKIMGETLGLCKIPENFTLLGGKDVFCGGEVVRHQDDTIPVKYLFCPHLLKGLDGKGRSDIISEGQIDSGIEKVTRGDLSFARMGGEDFFCNGHRLINFHIIPT